MRHVWAAIRLLTKNPRLWPAALAPMLLAGLANIGLLVFSLNRIVPWLGKLAEDNQLPNSAGWTVAGTLVAGAWILLFGPLFLIMFGVFSVPAWDALSRQVEVTVNGQAPGGRLSCGGLALDIIVRITIAVLLGGCALVLGCIGYGVVGAVLCGWIMLFDLSAPTYARRGVGVFQQYRSLFKCEGWKGFWLASSLSAIIPIVNVLMLPVLVVAATLMVIGQERKTHLQSPQPVE